VTDSVRVSSASSEALATCALQVICSIAPTHDRNPATPAAATPSVTMPAIPAASPDANAADRRHSA
jgi:hypothetical protein